MYYTIENITGTATPLHRQITHNDCYCINLQDLSNKHKNHLKFLDNGTFLQQTQVGCFVREYNTWLLTKLFLYISQLEFPKVKKKYYVVFHLKPLTVMTTVWQLHFSTVFTD